MSFEFTPANLDREFPVRRQLVYLNHAAVAPLPRRVADAMIGHVENVRDRGAADWRKAYGDVELTRAKAARFLGASPDEIAFLPNTSWAINLVALAYPWSAGDNVVTSDMEFPSNFFPWKALETRGVECRVAANRGGRIELEDLAAKIDARTRVMAVSLVAFHNGWVFPIEEIGAFCRERGILLFVDAIQGLGLLPLDVARAGVGVLAADAHKWLYGPESGAIFYVSEAARGRVPVIASGWWNMKSEGPDLAYRHRPYVGARRYEPGTLPIDHIRGLSAALDLLQEMGRDAVLSRTLELVRALAAGLVARGWTIATPEPYRSGILAAVPPTGPTDVYTWAKALEQRGVIAAPREGAIRFSPYAGNDLGEIERALEAVDAIGESP